MRKNKFALTFHFSFSGNTIQFARVFEKVIAIDLNKERLEMCKHNAKVYGVHDKIQFVHGDFLSLVEENFFHDLNISAVFIAPPWSLFSLIVPSFLLVDFTFLDLIRGGIDYIESSCFKLGNMPIDGYSIFESAQKLSMNIAYCLPRNVDAKEVFSLGGEEGTCEIELHKFKKTTKLVVAYYGDLIIDN